MSNVTELPRIPSDLIELALRDLAAVEVDPRYRVSMGVWHMSWGDTCAVCFAGAVMAKSLGAINTEERSPITDFSESNKRALMALDCLRVGLVEESLDSLGIPTRDDLDRGIAHYSDDPAAFRRDMEKLAHDLREVGL